MKNSKYSNYKILLVEGFARQVMPMMRYLRKIGCKVYTLNSSKLDMGYISHYPNKRILRKDWNRHSEEQSLKVLLEVIQENHYDLIIPLTDFSAILMSKNKEELEKYTKCAVNDWNVFQCASNKQITMEICQTNNIPCPKTINEVSLVEQILKSGLEYPFVIKPQTGFGANGFHRIDTQNDLLELFPTIYDEYKPLIVQDYVPQTGIQYKAEILLDKNGEVKSAIVFDKTRWYPIEGGSSCCCKTVYKPDIIENCVKLLKIIGWIGYADVDLIEDPRDNTIKIMEINPRITGSVKICFFAGVNFAQQIVELYLEEKVTSYLDYKIDQRLRYMHTDLLWFIESPNRFKSKPSWFNFYKTTDQIFSIFDPFPWFGYTIQGFIKLVGRKKGKRL